MKAILVRRPDRWCSPLSALASEDRPCHFLLIFMRCLVQPTRARLLKDRTTWLHNVAPSRSVHFFAPHQLLTSDFWRQKMRLPENSTCDRNKQSISKSMR